MLTDRSEPGVPTRGISVRQPWADCILHRGKDYENRTWPLPWQYRGVPVWLHAGKTVDTIPSWAKYPGDDEHEDFPKTGPDRRGALLGVVVFDDSVHVESAAAQAQRRREPDPRLRSPWIAGPYGWHIRKVAALPEPIPYRGALSFFRVNLPDHPI